MYPRTDPYRYTVAHYTPTAYPLMLGPCGAPLGFRELRVPPRPARGWVRPATPLRRVGGSLEAVAVLLVARWALSHEGIAPRSWPFTAGGAQPSVADCALAGHTQCGPSAITLRMRAWGQIRIVAPDRRSATSPHNKTAHRTFESRVPCPHYPTRPFNCPLMPISNAQHCPLSTGTSDGCIFAVS